MHTWSTVLIQWIAEKKRVATPAPASGDVGLHAKQQREL